jgi:hypothetical protein
VWAPARYLLPAGPTRRRAWARDRPPGARAAALPGEVRPARSGERGLRTAAIVSNLEESGLIQRTDDPQDQRRKVVTITPGGKRTLKRLQAKIQSAQDQLLAPLDAREREQLTALLARIGRT